MDYVTKRTQFYKDYNYVKRAIRNTKNMLIHFDVLKELITAFRDKHLEHPSRKRGVRMLYEYLNKLEQNLFDPVSVYNVR